MRGIISFVALLWMPVALWAQQAQPPADTGRQEEQDRGYLVTLLEDALSDAGREVRITGFSGALSSRASLEELTIADTKGVWLTLRGATLDWNRSALLDGRLEINALSAREILVPRLPATTGRPTTPEAGQFALPQLPVSVNIAKIKVDRVALGAPVIGSTAEVRLDGGLALEGGAGRAKLAVVRTDGTAGSLQLDTGYSNETRVLAIDLSLREAAGGIAASLLGVAGAPSLALTIKGTGPVDAYRAEIALASEGEPRLDGFVSVETPAPPDAATGQAPGRIFRAAIAGDIAPLFAPDYRAFFGENLALDFSAERLAGGQLRIDTLSLAARNMTLEGTGQIGADGWPERFALQAAIADPGGKRVLLPLPGEETYVRTLDLSLAYDQTAGDGWRGSLLAGQFERSGVVIARLRAAGAGRIRASGGETVSAQLSYSFDGISAQDTDLEEALGPTVTGQALVNWQQGEPLAFENLRLSGRDYGLDGQISIAGFGDGFDIAGRAKLRADQLSRFGGLIGQPLRGAAAVDLAGQFDVLGGAFDITLTAETRDLGVGQPEADRVLAGSGRLILAARRDAEGLALRQLDIETEELTASASGQFGAGSGALSVEGRLRDVDVFVPGLHGAGTVAGQAERREDNWQIDFSASGPADVDARLLGRVAADGTQAQLTAKGRMPLAFANPFIRPRSLFGMSEFDLALNGPLSVGALSGQLKTERARLSAPVLRLALDDIAALVTVSAAQARIEATGSAVAGGEVSASGTVSLLPPYQADLAATITSLRLSDPALYQTRLGGRLTAAGPLAGGARIAGILTLDETEMQVPETGFSAAGALPGLTHVNQPEQVRITRARAGLSQTPQASVATGPVYALDLELRAPARIFLRGRGLDAELGGILRLGGTTANLIPSGRFELIRGRLDILGRRLSLDEGLVQLQGEFTPFIRLVATAQADDVVIRIVIEGDASNPQISFESEPELPEDEVLARLLFGRAITEISPLQAARLAGAVATLAGGGGRGIIDRLRTGFGLDDLDIATDETGETGVRIGKYISENIYTDVTIGSDGTSEINLNLDLTPSLTAKGRVGSDGDTGIGLFLERDY